MLTRFVLAWALSFIAITCAQRTTHPSYRKDYHIVTYAVDLDSVTFDKVISQQNVTVVMFMHFLGQGVKQTEFGKFAESTLTQDSVIAATVGIIDQADKNNWGLAVRYGITMDQVPVVKLFIRGEEIATLEGELNCDNLRKFVTDHTGLWIGTAGTIQYIDRLVEKFVTATSDKEKQDLVDLVRQYKEHNATEVEQIKSTTYYIRIFEEYMKRGPAFLGFELARLKSELIRHKMHEINHCSTRKEKNIVESFQRNRGHLPHDEL